MGYDEPEIAVAATETVPLTADQDDTIDALNSGFEWYKPAHAMSSEHKTGDGHMWTITGHDMQVLTSTVPAGQEVITEVGSFVFMHPEMTTDVELTLCSKGGNGCARILSGESCVKVFLRNPTDSEGYVGLTPNYPAKIVAVKFGVNIGSGSSIVAQPGSYMTELGGVNLDYDLDCGLKTCCCAGFGACRQKISGTDGSIVFLSAGGTVVTRELKVGESIIVDSRSVLAYDDSVTLGIVSNGRFCTCCCGGEGCFSTQLEGPGTVWFQSFNFTKFQNAVQTTIYEQKMDRGGAGANDGDRKSVV